MIDVPNNSNVSVNVSVNSTYRKWDTVPTVTRPYEFILNSIPWIYRLINKVYTLDNVYWLTDLKDYLKIAREAIDLDHNWLPNRFDCDDFSAVLYCYARYEYGINGIGRVNDFVSRHSYNVCVTKDGGFYIIEPQEAVAYTLQSRSKKLYSLMFAIITF